MSTYGLVVVSVCVNNHDSSGVSFGISFHKQSHLKVVICKKKVKSY